MKAIFRWIRRLYSGPLQAPLVFAFTTVAAITVGVGAWVISTTVNNYLATTMDERVARDIRLADSYYNLTLNEVAAVADRLSSNPTIVTSLESLRRGGSLALSTVLDEIIREAHGASVGGGLFVAILDSRGELVSGHFISARGEGLPAVGGGNWSSLPIIQTALEEQTSSASTEIIPVEYLEEINLAGQAHIELVDTPQAAAQLFDPREGSAGLVIIGVTPILNADQHLVGTAFAFHLLNNNFALVDQIKETAGIDTVTIFMGDMRVSTNVLTAEGERAVGTRVSQEVGNIVLHEGREYVGTAFVVDQDYITRYKPLYNRARQIVGILYVGVRQASFLRLINTIDRRTSIVAILIILSTFILATPVSRVITQPLKELRELVKASRRVAEGDLNARAPVAAGGAVGMVADSFNTMLDTLQSTQDQLVHSEKLASLGQLAAGVAHELNNPLGTILLYSQTMMNERGEDDPDRNDLNMIVSETERCKHIVSDLLNFARQNQVIAQPTDIHALVNELVEMSPRIFKTTSVNFQTDFDPAFPIIEGDPSQLRHVFLNLVTNAVEAMPEGGTLMIRTRNGPAGMVTIEVQDTGAGIKQENLSKLFLPFFTTKPIGKGTGLGLAIVYGIVKMHRGQIAVQSKTGQGTTFTVTLPIHLPPTGNEPLSPRINDRDKNMIG